MRSPDAGTGGAAAGAKRRAPAPFVVSSLMLDQLPVAGAAERIRFVVTPGGHMLYAHDKSRATLRDEARKTIEATAER